MKTTTEKELFRGNADTLLFKTFRKSTVTLVITDQNVKLERLISPLSYPLEDIEKVERFKSMFMNIGLCFYLKNGKTVPIATRHVNTCVEHLTALGKM